MLPRPGVAAGRRIRVSFVVNAIVHIEPGSMESYLPELLKNARSALANEPGCSRFDVLLEDGRDDQVTVYEIYDDKAAFDAHIQSPHYLAMRKAIGHLIRSVDFRALRLVA
jgi:(4S)-4-hydroxy-5-phosphonooxypentane-2,3-dione isomerase